MLSPFQWIQWPAHSVAGGPNAPIAIDGGVAGPEPTDPDHQSHDRVPQRLPGVGTHVCSYAYVHDACVSHTHIYIYNTHTYMYIVRINVYTVHSRCMHIKPTFERTCYLMQLIEPRSGVLALTPVTVETF